MRSEPVNSSSNWSPERDTNRPPCTGIRFRVLILESPQSDESLVSGLNTGGYELYRVTSVQEAQKYLGQGRFELAILEIALPENPSAGFELLRDLRMAHPQMPVVLIGHSALLRDRVTALDAGSDDYLVRPLAHEEIRARVRAVLRRANPLLAYNIVRREVHLDWAERTARVSDRLVSLSTHEFDLLEILASKPGQVLSSRELADRRVSQADQIPAFVTSIRRKLGEHVIETVRGRGYRLGLI